jgi:hypothetical protein
MSLTYEEAIEKAKSNWWEGKAAKEIVDFQLYEERLCMDFSVFHQAIEEVLGRPVFTHEFADYKVLQEEYEGKRKYDGVIPSLKRVAGDKPIFMANPNTGKITKLD